MKIVTIKIIAIMFRQKTINANLGDVDILTIILRTTQYSASQ